MAEAVSWSATTENLTILIPIADPRSAGPLVRVASMLCSHDDQTSHGKVIVLGIVELPEGVGFTEGAAGARAQRELLSRLRRVTESTNVEVRPLVRVSRQVSEGIVETAQEEGANLILLDWKGWSGSQAGAFGATVSDVITRAPCDIAVVRRGGRGSIRRILVPVRGGPNAVLATHLASVFAQRNGARLTALHVDVAESSVRDRRTSAEEFEAVVSTLPDQRAVRRRTVAADGIQRTILSQARDHQMIVMGASGGQADGIMALGELTESVTEAFPGTVIVVKSRLPADLPHEQWQLLATAPPSVSRQALDLPARVDKWFAENTFDSDEFENIAELVRLKQRQNLTISLGLPALNEEETIGTVVRTIKRELMDRFPLLDEMVVIDSQSTDRTREIAADLGVPVHIHQETLSDQGAYRGKGEALWKSLHVLNGDIIAWIDTDIKNIHPRFVYGVVGPLLRYPRIQYVKGFYKRPIRVGGALQASGGGRVTELTARPLLNFFFPELSGVIQPLSGEYAGRRTLLRELPFFTGYGVEIGMLIDILERYGLDVIGQVDLKRRVHRNQGLVSLSGMAFTILQVVVKRLEERGRVQLLSEVNKSMKLIQFGREGFHVDLRALEDVERPPMDSIDTAQVPDSGLNISTT